MAELHQRNEASTHIGFMESAVRRTERSTKIMLYLDNRPFQLSTVSDSDVATVVIVTANPAAGDPGST